MFQFEQCAANTYVLKCFSNIGVYHFGNGEVLLIDSGDHRKSVSDLDKALCERGWRVKTLINTHCHVDHIAGNRFFLDKYGCRIYAPKTEHFLVEEATFEPEFYYIGIPTNRKRNFFFKVSGTPAEVLTPDVLPAGFELLPLPGHSVNMVGIKTPDDVWFLGDAVLTEATFEDYKLPSFYNINESIATQEMLQTLPGRCFIPSHVPPTDHIAPLAAYNANALRRLKTIFLERCNGKSFEEVFSSVCGELGVTMDVDKYTRVSLNAKCIMQALIDDGAVSAHIEGARLVYDRL